MKAPRGQAMIEFALVLPVLIVVSLGMLVAAMFYQRAIALSGAAFLADRAAAVQGTNARDAAREVLQAYAQDLAKPGKPAAPWVTGLDRQVSANPATVQVALEDRHESWGEAVIGALRVLGGHPQPIVLADQAIAPQEFVPDPQGGRASEVRRPTSRLVDYQAKIAFLQQLQTAPLIGSLLGSTEVLATLVPGGAPELAIGLDPLIQAYPANRWKGEVGSERQGVHPSAHDYVSADNGSIHPNPADLEAGLGEAIAAAPGIKGAVATQPQLVALLAAAGPAVVDALGQLEHTLDQGGRAFFEAP